MLVTLTTDVGKILASLHRVQSKGDIKFLTAVKIAHVSIIVIIINIPFKHYYWCFLLMNQLVYEISWQRAKSIISDETIQSKYRLISLLIEFSFLSVGVKTQTREKSQNEDCCVCGKSRWSWWKGSKLLSTCFCFWEFCHSSWNINHWWVVWWQGIIFVGDSGQLALC